MRRGTIPEPAIGDEAVGAGAQEAPTTERPPVKPRPETLRTTFEFELPRGYLDQGGVLHKTGTMRLATARDELLPMYDDRVRSNPNYLTVVLLARVITRLGDVPDEEINPSVIENLFASDLAFLQDLYRRINTEGHTKAVVACPSCGEHFTVDLAGGGQGER